MTTLLVQHDVASYDDWKPLFDGNEDLRRLHHASGHRVLRDGNHITVLIDFPDASSARSFAADPSLRETMSKAGVIGAPTISVADTTETIAY